jgi:hypothetical protein
LPETKEEMKIQITQANPKQKVDKRSETDAIQYASQISSVLANCTASVESTAYRDNPRREERLMPRLEVIPSNNPYKPKT